MTSKFWFLVKQSFNKKVKTKWFVIANLLLAIVLIGMMNIDSIISFFGGDFSEDIEMIVIDDGKEQTKTAIPLFQTILEESQESFGLDGKFQVTEEEISDSELEKELQDTEKVGVVLSFNEEKGLVAKIVSHQKIESVSYQAIVQSLNSTKMELSLLSSSIDPEELAKITSPIEIDRVILDEAAKNEDENMAMIMGTVFPTVILPFFLLVVFLVQMIGSEINEEKSTRSMEIIISNVSPKVHFFSKVLSSNAFVLFQGALLLLYAGIGFFVRTHWGVTTSSGITDTISGIWSMVVESGIKDQLPMILVVTLVLMILSFIAYSLIAGILASMTVNMEDFQQIQTPIMMICLLGYYLAIMAGMFEGSLFIRLLSYVPFLSCLLAPALLVVGQIGLIDVVISILILCFFNYLMVKYGLRIYKVGILNYSTDKLWKRIFEATRWKEK